MKKRADKRVQLKRLRFQVKQAFSLNQGPLLLLQKLAELESAVELSNKQITPLHKLVQFQGKLLKCIDPKTDN